MLPKSVLSCERTEKSFRADTCLTTHQLQSLPFIGTEKSDSTWLTQLAYGTTWSKFQVHSHFPAFSMPPLHPATCLGDERTETNPKLITCHVAPNHPQPTSVFSALNRGQEC